MTDVKNISDMQPLHRFLCIVCVIGCVVHCTVWEKIPLGKTVCCFTHIFDVLQRANIKVVHYTAPLQMVHY